MIKVFLVDDEVLARVGMKSLIPWNENGFEITGEFENGQSALEAARKTPPDIIITDIKMPLMNGLELIGVLKKENKDIRFIILSSHDDFQLVRQAMKAGADDYILKLQMEGEELLKILENLKKKIEQQKDLQEQSELIDIRRQQELQRMKDSLLSDLLLSGNITEKTAAERVDLYQMELSSGNLICLRVVTEEPDLPLALNDSVFNESIISVMKECLRNYGKGQAVCLEKGTYALICSLDRFETADGRSSAAGRMKRDIADTIKNTTNVMVQIGVSNIYSGFSSLNRAWVEAGSALKSRESVPVSGASGFSSEGFDQILNILSDSLKKGNLASIQTAFDSLVKEIKQSQNMPRSYLTGKSHILIFIINEFISKNRLEARDIWGDRENSYHEVSTLNTAGDYVSWLKQLKNSITEVLNQENESHTIILRARQYVHRNLQNNISLADISDHLGLSPSYFSRIFSRATGRGFIDYVTEEKIARARELLKSSNSKVYEIAASVGYSNVHYFGRVFKKTTGLTPLEFKKGKDTAH